MYGRSFLEHHKRRLCGASGARPAVAASQVVSEVSDDEHHPSAREPAREHERAAVAAQEAATGGCGARGLGGLRQGAQIPTFLTET